MSKLKRYLQVRFVVMNNIFQTGLPIHRQYDLKGSTQGRQSRPQGPEQSGSLPRPALATASIASSAAPGESLAPIILKDLDLDIALKLEEGWHERYV